MAENGSEKRQRNIKRTVRLNTIEDALLVTNADLAGLTVASYLRAAALKMSPIPAARRPTVNERIACQLLGKLGDTATAFTKAAEFGDPVLVETAINDLNEYRLIVLESIGRQP